MMVFGWRGIIPDPVYYPPGFLKPFTYLLMFFSMLFFISSVLKTRIRQIIRHPQLTGLLFWSIAHLLQNGDVRSILLFGWLAAWAVLEMILINRRDGVWVKEGVPGWVEDVKLVVVVSVIYTVLLFVHPYISGIEIV